MSKAVSDNKPKLVIEKFSLGVGDRFAHQAKAQLEACRKAEAEGVVVVPVWNKSNREHVTVGSEPTSVRAAADAAVRDLGWKHGYYVDADHINLNTVDRFLAPSNFFTLDVADTIGKPADKSELASFLKSHPELTAKIEVHGLDQPVHLTLETAGKAMSKYLAAVKDAGRIYRHVAAGKPDGKFVTEVSMDETDCPQTPSELLLILAAIADEKIPIQTIAPKFTGRFNKGVDYVGDVEQFEREFNADLAVIAFAVERYGLPSNLKLSVHSGSDKFSIYGPIRRAIRRTGAGLHVKTAGTTWLEELIGLAEAGGAGLKLAQEIYADAYDHLQELSAPYASVIDIHDDELPTPTQVNGWTSEQYTGALRHDQKNSLFNAHFRQLLHVGYKIAAKKGEKYTEMLKGYEPIISRNVTENLFDRHIRPIFLTN